MVYKTSSILKTMIDSMWDIGGHTYTHTQTDTQTNKHMYRHTNTQTMHSYTLYFKQIIQYKSLDQSTKNNITQIPEKASQISLIDDAKIALTQKFSHVAELNTFDVTSSLRELVKVSN